MSIISILVALVLVGLALWVVGQIPMDATIRRILHVVVVVLLVLWLLKVFGLLSGGPSITL
jgi:hypothetical protein